MKNTLRAIINRRDYCWKCRSVYGENRNVDLKALNKQKETLTA